MKNYFVTRAASPTQLEQLLNLVHSMVSIDVYSIVADGYAFTVILNRRQGDQFNIADEEIEAALGPFYGIAGL